MGLVLELPVRDGLRGEVPISRLGRWILQTSALVKRRKYIVFSSFGG